MLQRSEKAPDTLVRVPEMMDTPPILQFDFKQVTMLPAFFYENFNVYSNNSK